MHIMFNWFTIQSIQANDIPLLHIIIIIIDDDDDDNNSNKSSFGLILFIWKHNLFFFIW